MLYSIRYLLANRALFFENVSLAFAIHGQISSVLKRFPRYSSTFCNRLFHKKICLRALDSLLYSSPCTVLYLFPFTTSVTNMSYLFPFTTPVTNMSCNVSFFLAKNTRSSSYFIVIIGWHSTDRNQPQFNTFMLMHFEI